MLLATGGGPTMYLYHTPSGDKSCDGMAMALRLGLTLRDMEMVQFHPTGLLAGPETRMTGTVLEEGLRGAGGWLLDGSGRRFMADYDPAAERATRDVVSRAIYSEMRAGRTSPMGGVWLQMSHLGPDEVRRRFPGMVKRCADCGFDLAGGRVEVVPTAHYMMGGVEFEPDGATALPGLFAAGEDCGGVHGANRLGGNGVANSTVFGGIAGDSMGRVSRPRAPKPDPEPAVIERAVETAERAFAGPRGDLGSLRERLCRQLHGRRLPHRGRLHPHGRHADERALFLPVLAPRHRPHPRRWPRGVPHRSDVVHTLHAPGDGRMAARTDSLRRFRLRAPVSDTDLARLRPGDIVHLDGILYTGREGV